VAYTLQTRYNSKNFTPAAQVPAVFGMPRTITGITIHHWGAFGQQFDQVRTWLCTNNVPTSAHYVVQAGLIACIVVPENAAWHAGTARGNATTIGVECRPEATDGDYATVAELIAELRRSYGDLRLYRHSEWVPTACPGIWDLTRLDRLARNGTPSAVPPPETPRPVAPPPLAAGPIQWLVEPGETLSQVAAYYNGPSVAQIAAANGIADPDAIQAGQLLTIPGPLSWVVDPGDTLSSIAGYYRVSVDYLVRLNGIADPDSITVGQVLKIQ
jgi:N-acetylmuramoyl-L-alanine amidase